jgi:p90 ribosomal S6 kinase
LGSGPGAGQEIKSHPFFSTIDFEKLYKKEITPPFIPAIPRTDNLFYFDKEFTNKAPEG